VERNARAGDRRSTAVTLSARGRETARALMALALERERIDTACLGKADLDTLKGLLARLLTRSETT
jgi:DNA-binding MarR family transcriptional regulator